MTSREPYQGVSDRLPCTCTACATHKPGQCLNQGLIRKGQDTLCGVCLLNAMQKEAKQGDKGDV